MVRGYSYIEVLVAAIVLAAALVPAADALRTVSTNSAQMRDMVALQYEALGRFETVLAEPWGLLEAEATATGGTTESSYSEAGGTPNRIAVWISPYDIDDADGDGDILTGADAGVVLVRVEMEGTAVALETLTSNH